MSTSGAVFYYYSVSFQKTLHSIFLYINKLQILF